MTVLCTVEYAGGEQPICIEGVPVDPPSGSCRTLTVCTEFDECQVECTDEDGNKTVRISGIIIQTYFIKLDSTVFIFET